MSDLDIFKEYVSNYDLGDPNIERKFYHSIRVRSNAKEIAESLELNEKDVNLATFIGLTHDLGRFLQWKIYGTFYDAGSIDHALLSMYVLFEDDTLKQFNIALEDENIIRTAIYNHNKYKIKNVVDDRTMLFTKIIRDADKIDLLYLVGKQDIVLKEDDSEITDVISNAFWNYEPINITECQTLTDYVLVKLAFVFDLNFKKSFEIVEREKLLDKLFDNLKYKDKYEKYYRHAKEYVQLKRVS